MTAELRKLGATVDTHPFVGRLAGESKEFQLRNIYAQFHSRAPRQFVLATHFDTRPWADSDPDPARHALPVPGANDGTSGVVALFALARTLPAVMPRETGLIFAFFDGEELGRGGDFTAYCAGSRQLLVDPDHMPAAMRRAELGIVLDMVADPDLSLAHERFSEQQHPQLMEYLKRRAMFSTDTRTILDDHVFLSRAGIPSVLLIDHDYAHWHTVDDDLRHTSARSLQRVSQLVHRTVVELARSEPLTRRHRQRLRR